MIEWDLSISKDEAINLLHEIIQTPEKPPTKRKKLKGQILGNNFEITIKRSIIWGTAFRKEIEGKGSVVENGDGSRIKASIEVCSPYRYVNLNAKKLGYIVPLFVMSWVGLIIIEVWARNLAALNYMLVPLFFVTCAVLLIGFQRYLSIDDKFKDVIKIFETKLSHHRKKES
jgi:hypothetical protein